MFRNPEKGENVQWQVVSDKSFCEIKKVTEALIMCRKFGLMEDGTKIARYRPFRAKG